MIGLHVGDYHIERLIAKGGMGRVYEAQDTQLQRPVAVKIITLDEELADEMMNRFRREAQAISSLDSHANIVTIYRYGKEEGIHYIAMKYIDGIPLSKRMKNLRQKSEYMAFDELIHIARQVAAALDYAHKRGVIHRDVKPANIMLETTESEDPTRPHAVLMDFGLVLRVDTTVTTGSAFGTPRYISPEQAISSASANPQSDIYSFGVIIYEILTGNPPFEDDETPIGIALSHVTKPPPSPREWRPELNQAVENVMLKVLAKKPEDRHQTAIEFINALEQALAEGMSAGQAPRPYAPAPLIQAPPIMEDDSTEYSRDARMQPAPVASPAPAKAPVRRGVLPIALIALVVVALLVAAFVVLTTGSEDTEDTAGEQSGDDTAVNEEGPVGSAGNGQLELFYDETTLTVRNPTGQTLNLTAVVLRQNGREFPLSEFGGNTVAAWPPRQCGYVLLRGTELRRPDLCNPQVETGSVTLLNNSNMVWESGDSFGVYVAGSLIQRCEVAAGRCMMQGIPTTDG